MSPEESVEEDLPVAQVRPRRRWSYIWLLPIACGAIALWLVFTALNQRGIPIEVQFQQGHGIKPGDALRYRGITVGKVRDIQLTPDLKTIRVDLRVKPDARHLTRSGSQFWIVRPQLDLSGATGLETVVGAKYLSVLPGQGEFTRTFVGLETPPISEVMEPGGLKIVLVTPNKGSLRSGAPLSYRQVIIGTIVTVDLAKDASSVEARVYIKPDYLPLIRENTRFWKTGGARFSAGLTGLSVAVDSVQSLILGGVDLAIPPDPGQRVSPGHLFTLHDEPDEEWLRWVPLLSLYDTTAQERPHPLPAILHWEYRNFVYLTQEKQRRGWLLPVETGFLGPSDMLNTPEDALTGSARLLLIDNALPLDIPKRAYSDSLSILPIEHSYKPWSHERHAEVPEDTLVIANPDSPPRFVAANRYRIRDSADWILDPTLGFDANWHGASVVAERDGALLGILLITEGEFTLARLKND